MPAVNVTTSGEAEEGGNEKLIEGNNGDPTFSGIGDKPSTSRIPNIGYHPRYLIPTLLFGWMKPLLDLGKSKALEADDLFELRPQDTANQIEEVFLQQWTRQLSGTARFYRGNPSLTWAFVLAFGWPFLLAGCFKLCHDLMLFVGPYLLKRIILYLDDPNASIYEGLSYALGLFLSNWGMSICLRQYFFQGYSVGMRLRSATIAAVFHKTLVLSASSLSRKSTGEITNLMSVDAQRLQEITLHLHALWYSFVQVGLAIFFLWRELGPSCLAGCFVVCLMIPLTGFIADKMKTLQKKLMVAKDERQKVNNEVISGMKGIKMLAWEIPFRERLQGLRDVEQGILRRSFLLKACTITLWSSTPLAVALVTFTCYVVLGNSLEVSKALTAIALFDILRFPLFVFPTTLTNIVEARVTINRLQAFLLSEERTPVGTGTLEKPGLEINMGTFVWDTPVLRQTVVAPKAGPQSGEAPPAPAGKKQPKKPKPPKKGKVVEDPLYTPVAEKDWTINLLEAQLREAEKQVASSFAEGTMQSPTDDGVDNKERLLAISRATLKAYSGQLVGIVGQVGSGKSTLLAALLGEVRALGGAVAVQGKVAYVGQRPFIQNATLRDNILFGLPYDEARYQATLRACALSLDLQALPHGDLTQIGERGINLSGGQKARVGLARAVYANADVYLLDDPLSAVDAHVGRTLFEKCVKGMLRGKCVVMVTNALQHLPAFDWVYVLRNGRVVESGSFARLITETSGPFYNLMQANADTLKILGDKAVVPKDAEPAPGGEAEALAKDPSEVKGVATGAQPAVAQEERETGSVTRTVYLAWVKASGGYVIFGLCALVYCLSQTNDIITRWWLSYWSESQRDGASHGPYYYLGVYASLNLLTCCFFFIQSWNMMTRGIAASRVLYQQLLNAVLRAPMEFFDTTPLGRVINRFSKDMHTVDESLPNTIHMYLNCITTVFGTLLVVCAVTPFFTVVLVPLLAFYLHSQRYFLKTSRELKRLESLSRSPIYALFSETIDGLMTIRAFQAEERCTLRNKDLLDRNQRVYFLTFSGNCWLAIRLELAGALIVTFAALFAVLEHGRQGGFASVAGLSISFALSVTQALNWSVRMASQLESEMVSVERIGQYVTNLLPEAPTHIPETDPPPEWPTAGEVVFKDVHLRYRPGLPLVLKGLSFTIKAREKVGVVGRTGAGKSSLVVGLLRLVELDQGSIHIDGIDAKAIGLQPLRGGMAVIPQDPLLFSGDIRGNLDPFGTYSDVQLWNSIERVGLGRVLTSLADVVEEGGRNFSIGQRQLLCIARALLLKSRIILMDEATAAIDVETDAILQNTIRTEFAAATTITIAHRLNTILDSDRVLVMDDGRAAEFDSPANLMARTDSIFYGLVKNWESSHS